MKQLIGFYGDNMGKLVPNYLEQSFAEFTKKQDEFRAQMNKNFGGIFPMSSLEELSKQNMAMFENAMKAFTAFTTTHKNKNGQDDK